MHTRMVATFVLMVMIIIQFSGAQEVTAHILQRVFRIHYGKESGSSFTVDVDKRQYLITARHLVAGIKKGDHVEILRDTTWIPLVITPLFPLPNSVDIAVLAPPFQISATPPLPVEPGLDLSQDVYFLGFPYGWSMDDKKLNAGFPFPFVKKGIVSGFKDVPGGGLLIVIDGLNNLGFSGGPVVFQDHATHQLKVTGVVSGYFFGQEDAVMDSGHNTSLKVLNNSGLLIAYGIQKALEVIQANPIGAPLKN